LILCIKIENCPRLTYVISTCGGQSGIAPVAAGGQIVCGGVGHGVGVGQAVGVGQSFGRVVGQGVGRVVGRVVGQVGQTGGGGCDGQLKII